MFVLEDFGYTQHNQHADNPTHTLHLCAEDMKKATGAVRTLPSVKRDCKCESPGCRPSCTLPKQGQSEQRVGVIFGKCSSCVWLQRCACDIVRNRVHDQRYWCRLRKMNGNACVFGAQKRVSSEQHYAIHD